LKPVNKNFRPSFDTFRFYSDNRPSHAFRSPYRPHSLRFCLLNYILSTPPLLFGVTLYADSGRQTRREIKAVLERSHFYIFMIGAEWGLFRPLSLSLISLSGNYMETLQRITATIGAIFPTSNNCLLNLNKKRVKQSPTPAPRKSLQREPVNGTRFQDFYLFYFLISNINRLRFKVIETPRNYIKKAVEFDLTRLYLIFRLIASGILYCNIPIKINLKYNLISTNFIVWLEMNVNILYILPVEYQI